MAELIICIDGFGKDFLSEKNAPFLYNFSRKNYLTELKTLFAFTGLEYSFFSGKFPDENGIWLEFSRKENSIFSNKFMSLVSFNDKLRNYFGILIQLLNKRTWLSGLYHIPREKLRYFDTSTKDGLWKLDYFKNKDFCFYKWPFYVIKKEGHKTNKLIFKYEDDEERLKRLIAKKGLDVYYTQLMEIDKAVHKYGKRSERVTKVIKRVDSIIKKYVEKFLEQNPNANILIWSDHGFADIKKDVNIEKIIPKRKDYLYFIAGTTVSFWFENESAKKEVLKSLNSIRGHILDAKTAKKYHIPFTKKYGDLIFYLERGGYFFPNFYQKKETEKFKAMHGYPDDKELNGVIISNIKIPKELKMHEVINYLR